MFKNYVIKHIFEPALLLTIYSQSYEMLTSLRNFRSITKYSQCYETLVTLQNNRRITNF